MADHRPIGAFDSGLGGLSVVKELHRVLPGEDIVYFGDTGRVPYGTKSADTIVRYARDDEAFLLSHDVKLIIAACGTVSSVASSTASSLPVPFIGVVDPACRAAVKATRNNRVGLLGTSATIRSGSYEKRLKEWAPEIRVTAAACPLFVSLVESGWITRDDPVTVAAAKRYLAPVVESGVDTLILGCTHFPILSDIIRDIVGEDVTLINTGTCAAEAAALYLSEQNALADRSKGNTHYYVSDCPDSFSETASILLGREIGDDVSFVDVSGWGDKNVKG